MAGNCEGYVAVFFACARVGAVCVTLNNTYTAVEMERALKHTGKVYFSICESKISRDEKTF